MQHQHRIVSHQQQQQQQDDQTTTTTTTNATTITINVLHYTHVCYLYRIRITIMLKQSRIRPVTVTSCVCND